VSIFSTLIQYSIGIPSQSNKKRERNKDTQIGKEEVKLSLLVDDMIAYLKTLKIPQKNS
jgi:hypothetical protein